MKAKLVQESILKSKSKENIVRSFEKSDLSINEFLIDSIQNGCIDCVKYTLENGAYINWDKELPIRTAAMYNQKNILKYLLEKGADVNGHNGYPLWKYIDRGDIEMVKYLLDKGADPDLKNNFHVYPIVEAIQYGYDEIVKLLADYGAKLSPSILDLANEVPHIKNETWAYLLKKYNE